MKRMMAAVVMVVMVAVPVAMGQVRSAMIAEPEAVQLLRIDMRKALLESDAAPKMTQARAAKLKYLQAQKDAATKDVSDAEVDVIEAQATEQTASLTAKSVEAQLKDAIKNAAQIPPRQAASAAEVEMLQIEAQKAKVQADAAARVAENRKRLLGQLQAAPEGTKNAGAIADAQADAVAADTNAALLSLEVEAAGVRVDSAAKAMTATPTK